MCCSSCCLFAPTSSHWKAVLQLAAPMPSNGLFILKLKVETCSRTSIVLQLKWFFFFPGIFQLFYLAEQREGCWGSPMAACLAWCHLVQGKGASGAQSIERGSSVCLLLLKPDLNPKPWQV